MTTYIAFMRAVNVAGHAVVKMTALPDAFAAAGCHNARTYIQSGNVIFDSPARDEAAILRNLHGKVRDLLGVEPGIFLRTLEEIEQLVERAPFQGFEAETAAKLYVVFLPERPRAKPQFPLLLPKEGLEAFAMHGREVLIVSRLNPKGLYGFPNNLIEKQLGISATSRNWNTVMKIVKFARTTAAARQP